MEGRNCAFPHGNPTICGLLKDLSTYRQKISQNELASTDSAWIWSLRCTSVLTNFRKELPGKMLWLHWRWTWSKLHVHVHEILSNTLPDFPVNKNTGRGSLERWKIRIPWGLGVHLLLVYPQCFPHWQVSHRKVQKPNRVSLHFFCRLLLAVDSRTEVGSGVCGKPPAISPNGEVLAAIHEHFAVHVSYQPVLPQDLEVLMMQTSP